MKEKKTKKSASKAQLRKAKIEAEKTLRELINKLLTIKGQEER